MPNNPNQPKPSKKENLNNYGFYSSIAFQMVAIVLIGAFGGIQLDRYLKWKFPVFTFIFSIIGVALGLYYLISEVTKRSKNNEQ